MSTAGKGVLTSSGKRAVGSGGKAMVFDADGECAECCGEPSVPCTDCDPGGTGTAPSDAVVAAITADPSADCPDLNKSHAYQGFSGGVGSCVWVWDDDTFTDDTLIVALTYHKVAGTALGFYLSPQCDIATVEGDWTIRIITPYGPGADEWHEKTTGFSCNAATGKISGTHAFGAKCFIDLDDNACGGNPTVTVPV